MVREELSRLLLQASNDRANTTPETITVSQRSKQPSVEMSS